MQDQLKILIKDGSKLQASQEDNDLFSFLESVVPMGFLWRPVHAL